MVPTNEGILYAWESEGIACAEDRPNSDWPRFQHDERNTGFYGADMLPPARIVDLDVWARGGGRVELVFTAPGDDWGCGRTSAYDVRFITDRADLGDPDVFAGAERAEGVQAPGDAGMPDG